MAGGCRRDVGEMSAAPAMIASVAGVSPACSGEQEGSIDVYAQPDRCLSEVTLVPIGRLRPADSPRLDGENLDHALTLSRLDAPLPPIIVHRPTMRVVDGMHRLKAAELSGRSSIEVVFFTGSEEDAFVLAVQANVKHGLPLSAADREAAVLRIIASHPAMSDRAIALSAGLSAKTIGAIRARGSCPQVTARIGKDGRVRPLDATEGRLRAYEVIKIRPEASLREIAREAGVAVGTARDVRARVQRGDDPLPGRFRGTARVDRPNRKAGRDRAVVMRDLMRDPTLRFSEQGRQMLRWLGVHVMNFADTKSVLDSVPPHCAAVVAELAWGCADAWRELAEQMERQDLQKDLA